MRGAFTSTIIALSLLLHESHSFFSPSRQRKSCGPNNKLQTSTGRRTLSAKTDDNKQDIDPAASDLIDKINKKWETLDTDGRANFLDTVDDDVPSMDSATREDDGRAAFVSAAVENAMNQIDPKGELRKADMLDQKEMEKEIEEIFAKDTKVLYDEMEKIREDHINWANEWAAKKAKDAAERGQKQSEEAKKKIDYAEQTYGDLLNSVGKEAREVEEAMKELEAAKAELNGDLSVKLASAGPLKKASVAGMIVFGVRAAVDAALMFGSDGAAHETGAAVQGLIALACAAYFFLS